ncbi:MAG: hypothetical protein DMD87_07825 [Candidatus Rokuibacteriota bacterium]|nr:MAG: hypothetical protein DMD87_07825 [Candidatus Rokubacteria bacterium]
MADATPSTTTPSATRCGRCQAALNESERVTAGDRVFCRTCYDILKLQLRTGVAAMSQDINYPMAAVGALLGGIVGALAWWGVTVLTKIGFGLVAVVIGLLVGHGTLRFAGGKRSVGLQIMAVAVGTLSFLVAVYLVNMTFINELLAQRGDTLRVSFPPKGLAMFYNVIAANFGIMKLVFLAIIMYEAWFIPRPIKLPSA